jgi:pimeloyl-ACP methyl ester carboxylesterase
MATARTGRRDQPGRARRGDAGSRRGGGPSSGGPGRGERSRRRSYRPLWTLLGLAALAALATVLSSRRIRPMEDEDWDTLLDDDGSPRGGGPFPSVRLRLAGPAGELAVDDGGSGGLPVVLVHGLGGSAEHWRPQLDHLRADRRALAVELRGHGGSEPPADGDYGIGRLADDLGAAVDDLGLESFVLAGHSLGASVAVEYAARHPERVAALLLVDPNGDQTRAPRAETAAFLDTLRADPAGEMRFYFKQILIGAAPGVAERVLADLERVPPDALLGALESIAGYGAAAALARYPGPKLAVISDLNALPNSLHRLVPDLPAVLMGATSHWPMLDRPGDFNRVLDGFLAASQGGLVQPPFPRE